MVAYRLGVPVSLSTLKNHIYTALFIHMYRGTLFRCYTSTCIGMQNTPRCLLRLNTCLHDCS